MRMENESLIEVRSTACGSSRSLRRGPTYGSATTPSDISKRPASTPLIGGSTSITRGGARNAIARNSSGWFASPLNEWDDSDYERLSDGDVLEQNPDGDLFAEGAPGGETSPQIATRADARVRSLLRVDGPPELVLVHL
jgi:hypothetical protein